MPAPTPADPRLAALLAHPAIWRGRSAIRPHIVPTGFPALDERLPGGGWPRVGLVEILTFHLGTGELYLLLPALARLTRQPAARWCAWIAPAWEPYAPALAAHGVSLARVLVVRAAWKERADPALWACEQALRSGACEVALAWLPRVSSRALRRLQLAAERGRTLAFLFRTRCERVLREPSFAVLRLAVEAADAADSADAGERRRARIRLLKSRGGAQEAVDLEFETAES
ncbi:MAG: translesion DNA synthesis-associated protein ImuA [Steroidobacteraceae bacterium]